MLTAITIFILDNVTNPTSIEAKCILAGCVVMAIVQDFAFLGKLNK